jgi:hypothetical protein
MKVTEDNIQNCRVTLAIDFEVLPEYTREEILDRLYNYLVANITPDTNVENIFDDIAIEGIDY